VGTGLAACPFRWDEGRLLSPRRPSPGLSKDQVAVVLDGDQRVQGLPARLDTRGNLRREPVVTKGEEKVLMRRGFCAV